MVKRIKKQIAKFELIYSDFQSQLSDCKYERKVLVKIL